MKFTQGAKDNVILFTEIDLDLHLILPDDPQDLFQTASEFEEIQWLQH